MDSLCERKSRAVCARSTRGMMIVRGEGLLVRVPLVLPLEFIQLHGEGGNALGLNLQRGTQTAPGRKHNNASTGNQTPTMSRDGKETATLAKIRGRCMSGDTERSTDNEHAGRDGVGLLSFPHSPILSTSQPHPARPTYKENKTAQLPTHPAAIHRVLAVQKLHNLAACVPHRAVVPHHAVLHGLDQTTLDVARLHTRTRDPHTQQGGTRDTSGFVHRGRRPRTGRQGERPKHQQQSDMGYLESG